MNLLELYVTEKKDELEEIFTAISQQHQYELMPGFLEKDFWITLVLGIIFDTDSNMLQGNRAAFKGGTALSKCWSAIRRFSEDIDLSIHWADLADVEDEEEAWKATTQSKSQNKKFREYQKDRLEKFAAFMCEELNAQFETYNIKSFKAKISENTNKELTDIIVEYPSACDLGDDYRLQPILLELGGRNRGRPTKEMPIQTYASDVLKDSADLPEAVVPAYEMDYIVCEKLTALHQFCTQDKELNFKRISRHWYDVDCLIQCGFIDMKVISEAMEDVVKMKSARWPMKGVNYESILSGEIQLIPNKGDLAGIKNDYDDSVKGNLFYGDTESFDKILSRISEVEKSFQVKS